MLRHHLAIGILCFAASLSGADGPLAHSAALRVWQDLPSEFLIELNRTLDDEQRLAWYVDPATETGAYPGATLPDGTRSLADHIEHYCAQAGLAWKHDGRSLWLYRPMAEAEQAALIERFRSGDEAERIAARNALLAHPTPTGIEALLLALGGEDATASRLAHEGIYSLLGASNDWVGNDIRLAFKLFSDPNRVLNNLAGYSQTDTDLPAPWAMFEIVGRDPAVREAIAAAVAARDGDQAGRDLGLAVVAAAARVESGADLLAWWQQNRGGGWQWRYVRGRVRDAARWAGYLDATEAADPAAVARAFDTAMGAVPEIGDQLSERKLDKQTRNKLEDRLDDLFGEIEASAAPGVARKLAAVAANAELHQQIRQAALTALRGVDDDATMERLVALRATVEDRQLAKAIDRTLAASDSTVAVADLSQRALARIQAANSDWRGKSDAIAEKRKTAEALGEAEELAPPQRKQLKQLGKDIDHLNKDMQNLLKEARETVQELGELRGSAAVTALGTVLVEPQMHQELRKSAAEALIVKRDPAMVEPLITAFTDDDWAAVRKAAAEALGRCRQPEAIAALRQGLTGAKSPLTRQAAARGLAMSRHPEAYALIKQQLAVADTSRERIMLILSLAATRDPAALGTLTGILQDATAALDDRLGAARALALIPTQGARDALTGVMASDQPVELKRMTLDSLKPMSKADVPVFAPILLEVLAARPQGELLVTVVENLRRCMFGLPAGDPLKDRIETAILDLIAGSDNNNARKAALNVFKYSDDPAGVVARLEPVAQKERNPVMRSFLNRAIAQLKAAGG